MNKKFLLNYPALTDRRDLDKLVENRKTYTLNNCEFSIYETFQNAENVRMKFHELTFTAMLRGKKSMKLEDKTDYFDYLPGETVLVSPGETMVIDFPEAEFETAQCITLNFNQEFLQNSFSFFNNRLKKMDEQIGWKISNKQFYLFNSMQLATAANKIMHIAMDDDVNKDLMADLLLKELLIRLMQTQAHNLFETNHSLLKNTSRMAFVINYIKENLHQKLRNDELAKMAYVSKSNFYKLFKLELGVSPNAYIQNERLKKSKKLLEIGTSIKEVAFLTGYSDSNHFIKSFKNGVGLTPKQFQAKAVSL